MRITVAFGPQIDFDGSAAFVERLFDYLKPLVDATGSDELRARFSDDCKEVLQAYFWDLSQLQPADYELLLRLSSELRQHLDVAMAPWESRKKYIYETNYEEFVSTLASVTRASDGT
ncbi:MAG: hypothetical protein ACK5P8_01070 [Phycisphaerae bacterium]|jgi:hypothetical protein